MTGAADSRFGPTLALLIRGLWARAGRGGRLALIGVAALVVAALGYLIANRLDRLSYAYEGPAAPAFELGYDGLQKVEPRPGELARFEHREGGRLEEAVAISSLRFAASPNPVATALPLVAERSAAGTRPLPGYQRVLEGRTKLGIMEGPDAYMVAFTARAPGRDGASVLLGKRLLVPGPGERPRRGVVIELVQVSDDERVLRAARRYPAAFFLNWPVNFWLDLAVSVRVPGALGGALDSFAFL
jgi:hypothetical protein